MVMSLLFEGMWSMFAHGRRSQPTFAGLSIWYMVRRCFRLDRFDGASSSLDIIIRMAAFTVVIVTLIIAAAVDASSYAQDGKNHENNHENTISFGLFAISEQSHIEVFIPG
jgi:hypothetical protein